MKKRFRTLNRLGATFAHPRPHSPPLLPNPPPLLPIPQTNLPLLFSSLLSVPPRSCGADSFFSLSVSPPSPPLPSFFRRRDSLNERRRGERGKERAFFMNGPTRRPTERTEKGERRGGRPTQLFSPPLASAAPCVGEEWSTIWRKGKGDRSTMQRLEEGGNWKESLALFLAAAPLLCDLPPSSFL